MKINKKYRKLLDLDEGYDNQSLANKIEKTSDAFAIDFAKWISIQGYNLDFFVNGKQIYKLLDLYKKENNL